jgi:hypothetical protein
MDAINYVKDALKKKMDQKGKMIDFINSSKRVV